MDFRVSTFVLFSVIVIMAREYYIAYKENRRKSIKEELKEKIAEIKKLKTLFGKKGKNENNQQGQ